MRASNSILVSILAMSCFGFVGCQAKDERINRPGSDGGGVTTQAMNANESMQMLAVQLDRTAETVHVLKALLDSTYRDSYNIKSSQALNASELSARLDIANIDLKSENKNLDSKKQELSKLSNLNLKIKRLLIDEDGKLQQLIAVYEDAEGLKNSAIKYVSGKAVDFSTILRFESFSIEAIKGEEAKYKVTHIKFEDSSSAKDKSSMIQSRINFVLNWSGRALDLSTTVFAENLSFNVFRNGSKSGQIRVKSKPESTTKLAIDLKDCVSISGVVAIQSSEPVKGNDGKTKFVWMDFELTAIDSSYTIPGRLNSSAQSCQVRPVVDLTRLL